MAVAVAVTVTVAVVGDGGRDDGTPSATYV